MEWKVDISRISGAILEQAKIEALRKIVEQLEEMNEELILINRGQ